MSEMKYYATEISTWKNEYLVKISREKYKELQNRLKQKESRFWILQEFILHLHDETRWPAKYFKRVINFYLSTGDDIPKEIGWTHCCREYSQSSKPKANQDE